MPQTDNFEKLIRIQFEDSPEELRALLVSNEFSNTILGIGDHAELNENRKNELLNEVTMVLLGLSPLEDLAKNLTPIVDNDAAKAEEIATQIFETVLYENMGIVPTSLSPRAEDALTDLEAEEARETASEQRPAAAPGALHVPEVPADAESASQTLDDIPTQQNVPRYAKPLTEVPKYNDNEQQ
jgi:hypothetical protein